MIGTGAAIALSLMAGASTAGQVYSTKKAGDLNSKSLDAQRTSDQAALELERQKATDSAALTREQMAQAKAQHDEDLEFQRERYTSAMQAWQPYQQAGQGIFGSLLDLTKGGRPGAVNLPAPRSAPMPGGGGASAGGGSGPAPKVDWTAPPEQLTEQLNGYFTGAGAATTETPYWVREAGNLVARGKELNDPDYANRRLMAAEVFGGGAAAPPMSTSRPSLAKTAGPTSPALPTSLLQLAMSSGGGSDRQPSATASMGRAIAAKLMPNAMPNIAPGVSLMDLILSGGGKATGALGATGSSNL